MVLMEENTVILGNGTLYFLNAAELIILIVSISSVVFSSFIILKHRVFHKNVMILLALLLYECLTCLFFQLLITVCSFFDESLLSYNQLFITSGWVKYLEIFRVAHGGMSVMTVASMMVERFTATMNLKSYENHKTHKLKHIVHFIYLFGVAHFVAVCIILKVVHIVVFAITSGTAVIVSLAIFVYSYEINRVRYKESYSNINSGYTLSERFQLRENIRFLRILRTTVVMLSIGNTFIFILIILSVNLFQSPGHDFALRKTLNFLIPFYTMLINGITIRGVETWCRETHRC